jgi:septum formation protein
MPRPIVLASASPRRQELLRQLVPAFEIDSADVDETPLDNETPWQTAERLAEAKAKVVLARNPNHLVIAGDTVVAIPSQDNHTQLAKPRDPEDAKRMLSQLSGREHLVITGVCLLSRDAEKTFSVTTKVTFKPLTDKEIENYVATGEPMDKAGAYAIQGGAAGFVERYDGSLTNVIGFPVDEIALALRDNL